MSHLHLPAAINRADLQDTDMEAIMDTIVDSLFCFFVTLGEFELNKTVVSSGTLKIRPSLCV